MDFQLFKQKAVQNKARVFAALIVGLAFLALALVSLREVRHDAVCSWLKKDVIKGKKEVMAAQLEQCMMQAGMAMPEGQQWCKQIIAERVEPKIDAMIEKKLSDADCE